jgi:hypothetical protein
MSEPGLVEVASHLADLWPFHIGYRDGQMRIILREVGSDSPGYALELHGLVAFFGREFLHDTVVVVSCHDGVGSFGWNMSAAERSQSQEIYLSRKDDPTKNLFRAIARDVVQRKCESREEWNFPG